MKIVIFSNIPAPYFVEYLNELSNYATVLAVFERRTASDRDKSWNDLNNRFECIFLDGINIGTETAFSPKIISIIRHHRNDVLIFANPTTPSGILGVMYCKKHGIRYALQSEGGLAKDGRGLKESIKRKIISGADLYLSGMSPEHDYFIAYGAEPSKVKQYPFSSLHKTDFRNEIPNENEKKKYKSELGIPYEKILIYVGRMIHCKGVDVLLRSLKGFDDIGVYLIGGKETDEYLTIRKQLDLKNIHYIEHTGLENLKKFYTAADVLVLPTRTDTWGLVINEGMSFGLPIITTTACVAGLELIEDGVNGFLINSEDYEELHKKIKELMSNQELCEMMSSNNLKKINSYNYEDMARIIYNHLDVMQ